jgi:hypothetical protein
MSVYPDEHHLSSWAGICPGNEESAGKRLRGRTTRKDRRLRRAWVEAAWAAGRTKASYLGAQDRRLAARRGRKRALLAVGHTLLVIFDHLLKSDEEYQDLGAEHFDGMDPERLRRYPVNLSMLLDVSIEMLARDDLDLDFRANGAATSSPHPAAEAKPSRPKAQPQRPRARRTKSSSTPVGS